MKRSDLLNRGTAETPIAAACWECSALLLCCTSQLYRGTCVVTSQTSHTRQPPRAHRRGMALRAEAPSTSDSLPTWWASASRVLAAAPTTTELIQRGVAKLDVEAVAGRIVERGFAVVDGFLGKAAAASIHGAIRELDGAGALRLGKIQHGVQQTNSAASRNDRIAFLPSIQAVDRPPSQRALERSTPQGNDAVAALPETGVLRTYVAAIDGMRERLSAHQALTARLQGSLDDCNFMCAIYPGGGARYNPAKCLAVGPRANEAVDAGLASEASTFAAVFGVPVGSTTDWFHEKWLPCWRRRVAGLRRVFEHAPTLPSSRRSPSAARARRPSTGSPMFLSLATQTKRYGSASRSGGSTWYRAGTTV